MKKLSLVVVLSLFVGIIVYGEDLWRRGYSNYMVLPVEGVTRVGIGTPGPMHPLDVNGTIRATGFIMTTGKHDGYVLTSDGSGVGTWQAPSGGGSSLWSSGSGGIYYNGGSVGLGTASPTARLGIAGLGANNDVSIIAISENTNSLEEFVFKGDFAGTGETGNLLKLETMWGYNAMTWRGDGYVGIGTDAPQAKLDVAGTVKMNGFKLTSGSPQNGDVLTYSDGEGIWQEAVGGGGGDSYWDENDDGDIYCVGEYDKVGIMTTTPNSYLSVGGDGNSNYAIYGYNATGVCGKSIPAGSYYSATGVLGIGEDFGVKAEAYTGSGMGIGVRSGGHAYDFYAESSSGKSYFAGKVGIGTDDPQSELAVNGTITAKEIEVQLTGWPDFVFSDNYNLMPLKKLEKHIKKEKSLPGIPTNKEVEENGVKLGDMQAKLLQKVEELTLYVIEQDKKLSEQNKKLTRLESENKELKQRISRLER